jgi:Meiotically up-regulated gene 113
MVRPFPPPPPPPAAAANILSGAAAATTPAATVVLTLHACRIEALCHTELDHRRIRMYCGACLKQHVEWFNVSAAEVTVRHPEVVKVDNHTAVRTATAEVRVQVGAQGGRGATDVEDRAVYAGALRWCLLLQGGSMVESSHCSSLSPSSHDDVILIISNLDM